MGFFCGENTVKSTGNVKIVYFLWLIVEKYAKNTVRSRALVTNSRVMPK